MISIPALSTLSHLGKPLCAALLLLLACLGVVIWDQSYQWMLREDYYFGFFTLPLCLYVLSERWPKIQKFLLGKRRLPATLPPPAASYWEHLASATVFFGTLFFALGAAMHAIGGPNIMGTYFNTGGFIGMFFGTAWFVSAKDATGRVLGARERWKFIGLLTFPGLVWFLSGPALYLMDTQIKIFLLLNVTKYVGALMNALDFPVTVSANYIVLPRQLTTGQSDVVGVADACSGVRSLTTCVFMGTFFAAIFVKRVWRKIVFIGISLMLALVLNFIRTTFLGIWAFKYGSASIDNDLWNNPAKIPAVPAATTPDGGVAMMDNPEFVFGAVHDIAGYVAMGLTFLMLLTFIPLINLRLRLSNKEIERLSRRQNGQAEEEGDVRAADAVSPEAAEPPQQPITNYELRITNERQDGDAATAPADAPAAQSAVRSVHGADTDESIR